MKGQPRNAARIAFKDAVRDHGPKDPILRFLLILLADFMHPDGTGWATVKVLAQQSSLPESSVREHLKRLDGTWFRRQKEGRRYRYVFRDPGPGVDLPTISDIRKRRPGGGIKNVESADPATGKRRPGAAESAAVAAARRLETNRDIPTTVGLLAATATDRPPSSGCVICPNCGAEFVDGGECGHCRRSAPKTASPTFAPRSPDLNGALDQAIGDGR